MITKELLTLLLTIKLNTPDTIMKEQVPLHQEQTPKHGEMNQLEDSLVATELLISKTLLQ